MGKYAPLKEYLTAQGFDHVPMTFAQIEKLLNLTLPASKRYPAWWSNNPSNNTMTREWLDAGYETEAVDIAGEKLVFRRVRRSPNAPVSPQASTSSAPQSGATKRRHPIFGCMKGTLTVAPGVDLTEPADPDWGSVYDD
jgi:hypothetical protein